MDIVLRYRGREISEADVALVRELIAARPEATRRALSLELCRVWSWHQLTSWQSPAKRANKDLKCMTMGGLLWQVHCCVSQPAGHCPAARL